MLALSRRSTHRTQEPRRSTFWQQRRARHNPLHSRWRPCATARCSRRCCSRSPAGSSRLGALHHRRVRVLRRRMRVQRPHALQRELRGGGAARAAVDAALPLDDFHQSHRRYQKGGLCAVKNRSACDLQLRTVFNDSLSLVASDGAVVGGANAEAVTWGADRWRGAGGGGGGVATRRSGRARRSLGTTPRCRRATHDGDRECVPVRRLCGLQVVRLARLDGSVGGARTAASRRRRPSSARSRSRSPSAPPRSSSRPRLASRRPSPPLPRSRRRHRASWASSRRREAARAAAVLSRASSGG